MKKIIVFFLGLTFCATFLFAQDIERNVKERLTDYFNQYTATAKISTPKLNSFDINYDRKTIAIYASESFAYQPFRPETVENIYNQVKDVLMKSHADYKTATLQSGKATATISKMIKTNGDGNVPDYSAPQKTCSLNLLSFLM